MRVIFVTGFAAFAFVTSAYAHHSFAMFDHEKKLTLTGTVEEFEYINPHGWLHVNVVGADGRAGIWQLEMGGINAMQRVGLTPDTLKPGDRVTVEFHPLKDGARGGQYLSAKLPDGRTVEGGDLGLPPNAR
jgi:hypothetical protein